MSTYIHELPEWPRFQWDHEALATPLAGARHRQGRLLGQMEALGFKVREQAVLRALTDDVLKTSDIEGETLDADQVRSSLARRLGIDIGGLTPRRPARRRRGGDDAGRDAALQPAPDRRAAVCVAVGTLPTGRSGMHPVTVGVWRDDRMAPMQVVSGPVGRVRVHFEAPPASRLKDEMRAFLDWFNDDLTTEAVLKAAQAHLWFVTIHPFGDGNGRIARAIADMALARSEDSSQRFYSMSAQIRQERAEYHRILEQTQHGTMDITPWMAWFLGCLTRAIEGATTAMAGVIARARFWEKLHDVPLNERQRLVINRLLDGFDGNLTTSKWATLTKSSQDTALRDILWLVERGVLVRNAAGGRSTSYSLAAR